LYSNNTQKSSELSC